MYLVSRKYQIKYTLNNNNNKFVLRQTNIFMPQHKRIEAQMSLFTQYPKSNNIVFEKSTSIKYHMVASSNAHCKLKNEKVTVHKDRKFPSETI